jgi:hypothetical protein
MLDRIMGIGQRPESDHQRWQRMMEDQPAGVESMTGAGVA